MKGGTVIEITHIIEEMDTLASSGTRVPGLRGKVLVDVERLSAMGEQLRNSVPADVQEAKEILKQKESIINQVYLEAQRIKENAERESADITSSAHREHEARVDETEVVKVSELRAQEVNEQALQEAQQITQEAQQRAYRIIDEAESAARSRREGADQYAREVLFHLEEQLADVLAQVRKGIDALGVEAEAQVPA